jgi:anti-anti-sigma factor
MIISLAGEWDIYRAAELRERLEPAYHEGSVVLDLSSAKYVTSCLISALVLMHKHRCAHGMAPARLAVRSAFVSRLFSMTGLSDLLPVYGSVEEALSCEALEAGDAVG